MFGVYIHWPFCLSKCIYCDFGSFVVNKDDINNEMQKKYFENCRQQLLYFLTRLKKVQPASSIYFGGGTPSLIDGSIVKDFINLIKNEIDITSDCEITLEANPTSLCDRKFNEIANAGVNRVSIGIQSFNDETLHFLGRKHSSEEGILTIEKAKRYFKRTTFDVIYGLPKQTVDDWLKELSFALSLNTGHISLYTLIVEKNTPLGKLVDIGSVVPKTEDEMAVFYDETNNYFMSKTSLQQYEVSNYAIKGEESRHNMIYWNSYDYIGLGAGAHGRLLYKDGKRYAIKNIGNPLEWKNNFGKGWNGIENEEPISSQERIEEILLMGLRLVDGINLHSINKRYGINLLDYLNLKKIHIFQQQGLLNVNNDYIRLTYDGLKILDSLLLDIVN